MGDTYHTIQRPTQGIYREKGSKFLSFAYPIVNEKEALDHIEKLKKEYHDARHLCYAYVLGRNWDITRAYDAGEPRHSAGAPILNQIKSHGLRDILVVVVRYFGGTKLGKSGLINAYKKATEDAMGKIRPVEKYFLKKMIIRFKYEGLSEIMRMINRNKLQVIDQSYDLEGRIQILLKESDLERVSKLFNTSPYVKNIENLPG